MLFSQIINEVLYFLCGILFGISASRYSILMIRFYQKQKSILSLSFVICFLLISFILFPAWLIQATKIGDFVYYVCLLLFFGKSFK